MAAAPITARHTPEELLDMQDGYRYELINGRLVERNMGAESSLVGTNIVGSIKSFVDAHRGGLVFGPNCGYQAFSGDPGRVRYPDGSFVRHGRLPGDKPPRGHVRIAPDLMIEVVSPNDVAWEIDQRVDDFLRAGTELIWVIYPDTRRVQVYRQGGSSARLTEADELNGENVLPGFTCRVDDLFAGI